MRSCRAIALAFGFAATASMVGTASADDYTLVPTGGAVNWQNNASWTSGTGLTFPNTNLDTANLSIGLTSNLALDVGATNVTVGSITMGGTAGARTSDVISTGGKLVLDNSTTNALIISGGVAGSTNRITAPIELNDNLDIDASSNNNLTIVGEISMNAANRTITNNIGTGPKLVLNNILLYDPNDVAVPKAARTITLVGGPNTRTELNGTFTRGDGLATSNAGIYAFSTAANQSFATFVYNAAQTFNPGNQTLQRSTYVVNDNLAFGPSTLTAAGAGTYTFTGRLVASNGNQANWSGTITTELAGGITIPNVIQIGNSLAFAGSNNITLTGALTQGNNRAIGNAIAGGASLTLTPDVLTNPTGISIGISQVVGDGTRTWIFDGAGTTIVNGKIVNNLTDDADLTINGNFEKRGTGRAVLNNAGNTMRGQVRARGGILVFGADLTWGNASEIQAQINGGIWYAPGFGAPGWDTMLGKLVAANSPGFFALPASAASQNFDFSTGLLSTNATNMSIGADGAVTYTGTVTPNATAGYNWGGNSGTLTLGANASVGANNVNYKNGGTVVLTGNQSYTGITSLSGANMVTSQSGILTKNLHSTNANNVPTPTVLSVNQIVNGGVDSTLGASTSDAANLVFDGGTLRYTGSGGSTDRLFTISTSGGTLDSSGTGALQFTNTGNIVSGGTLDTNRTLTLSGTSTANNTIAGVLSNPQDPELDNTLAVRKTGTGKWSLTGTNIYTGNTRVDDGILSISNPFLADASDVQLFGTGTLDLTFPAATPDTIDEFFISGVPQAMGAWGAIGNGLATFNTPFITGTGILNVSVFNDPALAGDYNDNGVVDTADYIIWREAEANGDTTLNNRDPGILAGTVVGQGDYNYWRARFGNTVVTGAALSTGTNVPEPASAMLAILALVGTIGLVNCRRRIADSR